MSSKGHLIELQHVYDGWSIYVDEEGVMTNRWADETGNPREGYEGRWRLTQDWIEHAEAIDEL